MAQTVLVLNQCSVKFAATSTALTAAPDFTCQVTSVAIKANPKLVTVPATMCGAETQAPGLSGWQMDITWLQDWDATTPGGLSDYCFDNDAKRVWYEVNPTDPAVKGMTGECWIVAGDYLGDAGTPLLATQTFPLVAKPAKTISLAASEA